ncbi:hypothetical protein FJU30_23835 [Affinibrenneria salicis]|uniref:Uncharacterized protein n=1 Tax=Affinibrenneria salicis TaxID=2590031 RepID=A0A5J5FS82_9GAMM|nr:hypothetical protein [Affinibrenneria salicis]KAA8995598.1 hypothetical protein FJU30_23835 [Affinibrenneria salicis]
MPLTPWTRDTGLQVQMRFFTGLFGFVLLWSAPGLAQALSTPDQARQVVAGELADNLFCKGFGVNAHADEQGRNAVLTLAGASIHFKHEDEMDELYNSYTYRFTPPLAVNGVLVHSIMQSVGEGGALFIAEAEGDSQALAARIQAVRVGDDEVFAAGLLDWVQFHKTMGRAESGREAESMPEDIIIGADASQKKTGRFSFGCSTPMAM